MSNSIMEVNITDDDQLACFIPFSHRMEPDPITTCYLCDRSHEEPSRYFVIYGIPLKLLISVPETLDTDNLVSFINTRCGLYINSYKKTEICRDEEKNQDKTHLMERDDLFDILDSNKEYRKNVVNAVDIPIDECFKNAPYTETKLLTRNKAMHIRQKQIKSEEEINKSIINKIVLLTFRNHIVLSNFMTKVANDKIWIDTTQEKSVPIRIFQYDGVSLGTSYKFIEKTTDYKKVINSQLLISQTNTDYQRNTKIHLKNKSIRNRLYSNSNLIIPTDIIHNINNLKQTELYSQINIHGVKYNPYSFIPYKLYNKSNIIIIDYESIESRDIIKNIEFKKRKEIQPVVVVNKKVRPLIKHKSIINNKVLDFAVVTTNKRKEIPFDNEQNINKKIKLEPIKIEPIKEEVLNPNYNRENYLKVDDTTFNHKDYFQKSVIKVSFNKMVNDLFDTMEKNYNESIIKSNEIKNDRINKITFLLQTSKSDYIDYWNLLNSSNNNNEHIRSHERLYIGNIFPINNNNIIRYGNETDPIRLNLLMLFYEINDHNKWDIYASDQIKNQYMKDIDNIIKKNDLGFSVNLMEFGKLSSTMVKKQSDKLNIVFGEVLERMINEGILKTK